MKETVEKSLDPGRLDPGRRAPPRGLWANNARADMLLLGFTGKGLPPSQCGPLACHWRRCRRTLLDSPLQQTGLEQSDVRRGNEGGRKSKKGGPQRIYFI